MRLKGLTAVFLPILVAIALVSFLLIPTDLSAKNQPESRLLEAARQGQIETVKNLLANGFNVNEIGRDRKVTALHLAVEGSHEEMVQFLIDNGAEVNTPPVWSPLHIAALTGQQDIAKLLLDNNADVDAGVKTLTPTPLHVAVRAGNQYMVSLLLERGADINAGDIFLTTALHWASAGNQLAIAEQLIEAGANLNSKGRWIQPKSHPWGQDSSPAVFHKLRTMNKDEMKELTGSAQIGTTPPVLKRENHTIQVGDKFRSRGSMPTLVLPWSPGSFPEIEQMLDGFGYSGLTPLDIAYEQDELAEMTMILAAHGAQLASELSQQEEN